jgi:hypothetical protein
MELAEGRLNSNGVSFPQITGIVALISQMDGLRVGWLKSKRPVNLRQIWSWRKAA